MTYEKDHHLDSPYVSVNTLINPRKNQDSNDVFAPAMDYQYDSPYVSVNTLITPRKNHGQNVSTTAASNLTISKPDDPAELEADRVADQVAHHANVLTPSHPISPAIQMEPAAIAPFSNQETFLSKEEPIDELKEKEPLQESKRLQTKQITAAAAGAGADSNQAPSLSSQINNLSGKGSPLPGGARDFFEAGFNQDFGNVRIHNDTQSQEMARSINAKAFTVGNHVVFGQGQYSPGTDEGNKLIAHELTHVIQQEGEGPRQIRRQNKTAKTTTPETGLGK